jgi:hypothetical protein
VRFLAGRGIDPRQRAGDLLNFFHWQSPRITACPFFANAPLEKGIELKEFVIDDPVAELLEREP